MCVCWHHCIRANYCAVNYGNNSKTYAHSQAFNRKSVSVLECCYQYMMRKECEKRSMCEVYISDILMSFFHDCEGGSFIKEPVFTGTSCGSWFAQGHTKSGVLYLIIHTNVWNKNQLMSLFQFYLYIAGSLHVSGPQAHPQESSHGCSHNHWFLVIQ